MIVIMAGVCVVIHISFGVITWVVFSDIVILLCEDPSRLSIVMLFCGVTLVLSTTILGTCIPGLFFWWGFEISDRFF